MGLWDFFQGFGESLEDWGGGRDYGMGSINPAAGFTDSFKGLDQVGYPGPINRPSPVYTPWNMTLDYGGPKQNESEQIYQHYLRAGKERAGTWGSPPGMDYITALSLSAGDRDKWPSNVPLRNAQHGFVGQVAAQESPVGRYGGLFAVPAYNLAKLIAQRGPSPVGRLMDMLGDKMLDSGPNSLTQASPPSWEAVMWGLRPWWGKD